jgi:hypothetical protein
MGALADFADYKQRLTGPRQFVPFMKNQSMTSIAGRMYDPAISIGGLPLLSAPTTAVVPTSASSGALSFANASSETAYCLGATLSATMSGTFILCDRLSHQGGLSGTSTSSQTTNLPTAALTRYTDGVGVMAGLSIYSQVGASNTTVSVSYTNEAGTAGQTSPSITFGGTGNREGQRFLQIPLVAGDTGVKSVESVTLAATTSSAGNFGVVLYKPLMSFHIERPGAQVEFNLLDGGMCGGMPEIVDDACLFFLVIPNTTAVAAMAGVLNLTAV